MSDILKNVSKYYSEKVRMHGATPKGADWNSEEAQTLRFHELLQIIGGANADSRSIEDHFSLLDFGCGYGALLEYLVKRYHNIRYAGFDISEDMLQVAREKFPAGYLWTRTAEDIGTFDYVIASGIFNVKQDTPVAEWEAYLFQTLDKINSIATRGFSFNMLTSWSDADYMKDYLYYANPTALFDHCKKNYSRSVALLHDYPLYEFSILVRKEAGQ